MKNFPNQATDLERIRGTLLMIDDLNHDGEDVFDDAVLGYALARAGAYTFRGIETADPDVRQQLETRITREQQKAPGSQGARTNAREMRRTLRALSWISDSGSVTSEGEEFLRSAPGSQAEQLSLALALLQLTVTDQEGHVSHPVRVMLDLLSQGPAQNRAGLELALEARDDSLAERDRVRRLYSLSQADRAAALGASVHQIANARKIFPSMARAAGLVLEDEQGGWHLSPEGQAVRGIAPEQYATAIDQQRRRARATIHRVTKFSVARSPGTRLSRPLTIDEQIAASALLTERTERHQKLVRATARLLTADGTLYEDPLSFDLLLVPRSDNAALLLFEMKTLAGDAAHQCRLAAGQLNWYHYFNVSPQWPNRPVIEIAVFDDLLPRAIAGYFDEQGIYSLWVDGDQVLALTPVSQVALYAFRVPASGDEESGPHTQD